jgi:hypothetical protein
VSDLLNNRKALIALAIVVAFVAIVVPTCRMVGCSMTMGTAMPFGHQGMPGFFGDCGGSYVTSSAPSAVVPSGADALVLALVAAVLAALVLFQPNVVAERARVATTGPPPPPDDPQGERRRL